MAGWAWRRTFAAAVVALTGVLAAAPSGAATGTGPPIAEDADWILAAQLPDGAIATYPDRAVVVPYVANLAATGLAHASLATGRSSYARAAWRALGWYQSHQDSSGFVADYHVVDGVLVSTGGMDSTDACAGMFLLAARETWRAAPDATRLRALVPGIRRAVAAIEATQDGDGLTWAKPGWRVKYLMDQAEVYAGLRSAADLYLALGDVAGARRADGLARRLAAGVESLWDEGTQSYAWAVHGDGTRVATDWTRLYPDALQQVWVVAFGLDVGNRTVTLVQQFAESQLDWAHPTATARFEEGPRVVGYWVPAAWAFRRAGFASEAESGLATIRAAAVAAGRSWPFSTADAGELVVAETTGHPGAGMAPRINPAGLRHRGQDS